MAKPKQVHESKWEFGSDVCVERGPTPESVNNPQAPAAFQFYVYELQDEDPTDTQDGVWKLIGTYKTEEAAFDRAGKLAGGAN